MRQINLYQSPTALPRLMNDGTSASPARPRPREEGRRNRHSYFTARGRGRMQNCLKGVDPSAHYVPQLPYLIQSGVNLFDGPT